MIFYLLTNIMSDPPSAADILHILSPLNERTYENLLSWFPETDELDFNVGLLEIAWEDDDKLWYSRSTVRTSPARLWMGTGDIKRRQECDTYWITRLTR
jgi:hypothetical protein